MKHVRSSSKSGLFLIELIIAIVFFAVASAICIQLFVKAYLISNQSRDLSAAALIAQNYAEQYKAMSAEEKQNQSIYSQDGAIYYGYDENGVLIELGSRPGATSAYGMYVRHNASGDHMNDVLVRVVRMSGADEESEEPLFEIALKDYEPDGIKAS